MDIREDFEIYNLVDKQKSLDAELKKNLNGLKLADKNYYLTDDNHIVKAERNYDEYANEYFLGHELQFGKIWTYEDGHLINQTKYDTFDALLSHYKVKQTGTDIDAMYRDVQTLCDNAEKRGDVILPITKHEHGAADVSIFVGLRDRFYDPMAARFECNLVAFAIADKKEIKKEFGNTPDVREKAIELLKKEIDDIDTSIKLFGHEYRYTKYDLQGEEGEIEYQDMENLIYHGIDMGCMNCELIENLGKYKSIEACLEANKEKLKGLEVVESKEEQKSFGKLESELSQYQNDLDKQETQEKEKNKEDISHDDDDR